MRRLTPDEAVDALYSGEVVAVPTDTVYGLAARLDRPSAIEAIFALKRRPQATALPVLVADPNDLRGIEVVLGAVARRLADRFWPGPLTLVVPAPEALASRVHASPGTVGVRVPADHQLRSVLARTGPLCVTSANEHGESPCTSAEDVASVFDDREVLVGVLDGGPHAAVVSTVVDVSRAEVVIVRAGAIDEGAIHDALRGP